MKKILLCSLFLLPLLLAAQKPVLSEATPESAGMSSARLHNLDSLLLRYVNNQTLPGVAAIVVRDGKIAYHKAFGMRDLEARDPLERDAAWVERDVRRRLVSKEAALSEYGVVVGDAAATEARRAELRAARGGAPLERFDFGELPAGLVPPK